MPFGSESKQKKILKKIIKNKDTTPPEGLVVQLLRMMDDEMSKRVLVHDMVKMMEKGLEEKKYVRMLCLLYRLMDVDADSFILNHLSIKEDMVISTLPKLAEKTTRAFSKHIQLKVNLFSSFQVLISAENDAPDLSNEENRDEAFSIIEMLVDIAKNIEEAEFTVKDIGFHVSDILLLELTITFYKIDCYSSSLANEMVKFTNDEAVRFIEIIKNIDRVRHKYFTILQMKDIKEKFVDLPRLCFMPTGPLQTFLNKRVTKKKNNESTKKIDLEIETFNQTFQADIASNEAKIKQFIGRPLISINDGEDSRESLSRSVSRSASSIDPVAAASFGSSYGGGSFEPARLASTPKTSQNRMVPPQRQKAKEDDVVKPVAKKAGHGNKQNLYRPTSSFLLLDDSEDD